ncbi:MAG: hypothetical protein Q9195_007412 [Heterodermia aff. obscurata]
MVLNNIKDIKDSLQSNGFTVYLHWKNNLYPIMKSVNDSIVWKAVSHMISSSKDDIENNLAPRHRTFLHSYDQLFKNNPYILVVHLSLKGLLEKTRAADGTRLALAVGEIPRTKRERESKGEIVPEKRRRIVTRLHPSSSAHALKHPPFLERYPFVYSNIIVALSYRSFWTSSGHPSEAGIKLDASAVVDWVTENFPSIMNGGNENVSLVLWGHSLGASVAVDAAAASTTSRLDNNKDKEGIEIKGSLLETPSVSVEAMLWTLYPQKWLPYRYLGLPENVTADTEFANRTFLRNHWDSKEALQRLASSCEDGNMLVGAYGNETLKIQILQAGKDELVPPIQGLELEACARGIGFDVRRVEGKTALHNEVSTRASGRAEIVGFVKEIGDAHRNFKKT